MNVAPQQTTPGTASAQPRLKSMVHDVCRRRHLSLRTKKPTVWFVAERSDLFHPSVDPLFVLNAFDVMSRCPHHRFMVLTKRPERMADWAERFTVNGLWYTNSGESRPRRCWG